ncbi:hypothetical protein CKM354_000163800 [Cercospora kikuchii]|uniref:Uncharacterized protein n=1 Tax=Cercospora kikuchii TaxID=84275 RepID=A0A9P3CDX6_9PEZI|nr:uncharacterized protein CKM354_000163800 [Cercospora kikuchii]GIZ38215.1 hypothetical protein CKM354_000163800 [Cercospora kikuchii]
MTEMRQTRGREGIVKKSRRLLEAEEDEALLVASQGRKRKRAARQSSEAETEPVQEPPPRAEQVVKVGSNEVGVEPPLSGQIDAIEEPQGAATVKAPSRAKPKRRGVRQTVTEAEPPVLQQKSTSPEARAAKSEKWRSKQLQFPEPPVGLDDSDRTAVSPTRVGILVITQTSSGEPPQETIASPGPSDTAPEIQQTQKPAMRRSKRSRDVEAPSKTTIKQANEIAKPVTRPPRRSKRSKKGPPQPGCLQLSPNTVENDIYLMVQLGVSNQTSKKRRSRIRSQEATPPQIKTPDTGKLAKRLFESMRSPVW